MGKSGFHQTCKKCGGLGHSQRTCRFNNFIKLEESKLIKLFSECDKPSKRPLSILTEYGIIDTDKRAHNG
jgi:hypothetical protein